MPSVLRDVLRRRLSHLGSHVVDVRPGEMPVLAWSWLYVFALFVAYYVLRPIRDELGVAGGVRNLPWLFTGTLLVMLVLNPLFGWLVRRWSRDRFVAICYRFFMVNLLAFMALLMLATDAQRVWIGRAFFIWVSVFNLFVVSVFWSLIVDVLDAKQGKRLFGFVAAGATLGGIVGAGLTSGLVEHVGQNWLLLASVVMLEVAVFAARRVSSAGTRLQPEQQASDDDRPVGGGVFAGLTHTFRSPYLIGISGFILLYAVTSTFLYFQQASIAEAGFQDRSSRTAFFANIDLWVNGLTLFVQLLLTGRLVKWMGMVAALCALPLFNVAGFAVLAASPTIGVFIAFQVARRVTNFALAKPTREMLFTDVSKEDRYKAKNFIDTVVYRAGDQLGSWAYAGLAAVGLGMTGISVVAVPLSLAWLGLGLWLGKQHLSGKPVEEKTQEDAEPSAAPFSARNEPR